MNPANNLEGAHKKLDGLKNITRRDIDNLYGRYRRLAEIEACKENLKLNSDNFAKIAKSLKHKMWIRTYGVWVGLLLFIAFALLYQLW